MVGTAAVTGGGLHKLRKIVHTAFPGVENVCAAPGIGAAISIAAGMDDPAKIREGLVQID